MKKTLIAGLASLMLAGVISAADAFSISRETQSTVLIGDGSAPVPSTDICGSASQEASSAR